MIKEQSDKVEVGTPEFLFIPGEFVGPQAIDAGMRAIVPGTGTFFQPFATIMRDMMALVIRTA